VIITIPTVTAVFEIKQKYTSQRHLVCEQLLVVLTNICTKCLMKEQISYVKDNRFSINSNFQHCAIVCKTFHPMLLDRCLPCPVCNVGVLWPNSCMDQDATWYGGRPRPRPHCVRCGPSSPPKRGTVPIFGIMSVVAKQLDGSRCHLVQR